MTPCDKHLTAKMQTKKRTGQKTRGTPTRESHFLSIIQISCGTHDSVFSFIAAVN